MEPTSARNAFPCLDEPEFKARFKISAIHNKNLKSISNMPVVDVEKLYFTFFSIHLTVFYL